jgi:RNA polymerase sigma-70 factor, ECF subfamily
LKPTLETIYQEHADFVWRSLLRLGVQRKDAGDAVQDVFLIVHDKLDQFEGRSTLSTWIFTICRTVAHKRRTKARRERAKFSEGDVESMIDLRADVGRAAEHNQDFALLSQILAGLERDQRNVFILFELEKMTGEDISFLLEIPLGTVYSRLQLARTAFRQALLRHEAKSRFSRLSAGGGS